MDEWEDEEEWEEGDEGEDEEEGEDSGAVKVGGAGAAEGGGGGSRGGGGAGGRGGKLASIRGSLRVRGSKGGGGVGDAEFFKKYSEVMAAELAAANIGAESSADADRVSLMQGNSTVLNSAGRCQVALFGWEQKD